ncbi:hypothetical protein SAPIO_CDS3525 [Scedosporium apiospermum]|uniref:Borealin N-terminal domain-containing protein n=1 Tax=Pseudallescheria apiosperma TaxID=563466 RepID=A0A084GAZ6_PSEDA|nr:uncharacterized protein SAPIO_CDS3525 [Scedosporium apiospermum]KEZ44508.1 hypothetical protein SAPIO_CDS3525 [Scedosporium apiospermum]
MTVPTKTGTPTRTPRHNRSPIKMRKAGLTIAQKQALIDNLQLEITERARRLRAQYNLQAQGLRSRIEIRVNRIPISLRKMIMGELLAKLEKQQERAGASTRPPPVPMKDIHPRLSPQKSSQSLAHSPFKPPRGYKRSSDEFVGPDKENELGIENPKKRTRGANVAATQPAQILSPTSSNSRLTPRKRAPPPSPTKSLIARPASPTKPPTTQRGAGLLSTMVEKAKATRAAGVRKATTASTVSTSSSSAAASTGTTRGRRPAATTATRTTTSRAAATRREDDPGSCGEEDRNHNNEESHHYYCSGYGEEDGRCKDRRQDYDGISSHNYPGAQEARLVETRMALG